MKPTEPDKHHQPSQADPRDDQVLIDYVLGEIDPKDKTRIELQLAERPELMREARSLRRLVSHMGVSMITPSPHLVSRTRHAAYEARTRGRGRLGLFSVLARRPLAAALATLIIGVFLGALLGPNLLPQSTETPPEGIGSAATLPADLQTFLQDNLGYLDALQQGQSLPIDDFSVPAGQAMKLIEGSRLSDSQRLLLEDIKSLWGTGYERVNAAGEFSDEIMVQLRSQANETHLIERIEAILRQSESGR